MKTPFITLTIFFITFQFITAQNAFYFDKKFKRVNDVLKARYVCQNVKGAPINVKNMFDDYVYAHGILHLADTLSFDGIVEYFDKKKQLKGIKNFDNGVEVTPILIDSSLRTNATNKKKPYEYYLHLDRNGAFYAYKTNLYYRINNLPEYMMYARGRCIDSSDFIPHGKVLFYDENEQIADVKIFNNGVEQPFLASTIGTDEPHVILEIITHVATNWSINIDAEMKRFMAKCKQTDADGVIGIHTSTSTSSDPSWGNTMTVTIQGTTIKLKNKKSID